MDVREKLAELERVERHMRNAESARSAIRVGYNRLSGVVVADQEPEEPKKSLWVKLGFKNDQHRDGFKTEVTLTPDMVDAIYEALAEVRDRHYRHASKLADELGTKVKQ